VNHFERALELAERGRGKTGAHPLVGAVVVRDGEVVGEGWYEYEGVRHAEVIALEQAGDAARGAILYVTLEPCSHHGRTPPCADAVVAAGVARVVVGAHDPNPVVDGRGLERLRAAGTTLPPAGRTRRGASGSPAAARSSPTRLRSRSTGASPFPVAGGFRAKSRGAGSTSCEPLRTRSQ